MITIVLIIIFYTLAYSLSYYISFIFIIFIANWSIVINVD